MPQPDRSSRTRRTKNADPRQRGIPARMLNAMVSTPFTVLAWLLGAVALSILIEWLGILFWWDSDHAQRMLVQEAAYLNRLGEHSVAGFSPGELSDMGLEALNGLGLGDAAARARQSDSMVSVLLASAINILYLLTLRLTIVLMSITAFVLVGIVFFIDGLVERDIRKFCGGHESSTLYDLARPWLLPAFIASSIVYLTIPVSVNPAFIYAPALALLAVAVFVTASRFKKFL